MDSQIIPAIETLITIGGSIVLAFIIVHIQEKRKAKKEKNENV